MYKKLTQQTLEEKLRLRFEEGFLSLKDLPKPSVFKDIDRATKRIVQAINNRESITVVGDYDVDGVTSTTLMKLFFEEIDYPVAWTIPNRFKDGYGLSMGVVARVEQSDLIITVDNGISAVEAAKLCQEKGIDLIITDHHLLPSQIPEAYAIVDPKQPECTFPYEEVCGAQIAWYLIASLKNALRIEINMIDYMELVAIAIIADMMPLRHINRVMVQAGIKALNQSKRPCIRVYMEHCGKESVNAEEIAFFLAPLINSAGRMDDASYAVEFLASTNIYDARIRLERLVEFNTLRKSKESDITKEALKQVDGNERIIVVEGEGWHEGVIGIVAARVARYHEKPCIVLSRNEKGILKGSGRSFGDCDLFGLVNRCRQHLETFGGHEAAIGLSLFPEKLKPFKEMLQNNFKETNLQRENYDPDIAGELRFSDISFSLTAIIKAFEPYGQGNPTPKFISRSVKVLKAERMGKAEEHLRFVFAQEDVMMQGVKFKTDECVETGSFVDIVYTLNENHFRGNVYLQLMIDKII